ncbi:hypothetical protein BH20ACI4_BH20ACI4_29320 [soil metagenome]
MMKSNFVRFVILICVLSLFSISVSAQQNASPQIKSQEVSDVDGIPVLIKHLPDWENARNSASLITSADELKNALGERPVFDSIEFIGGTEAVTAPYPEGKLLIVEYSTPQASADIDNKINQRLAETLSNPPVFYRRIGNYNVFLFDGTDETAANALFDQIKYEKTVQWLGEDPTLLQKAERAIVKGTADMFLSTATAIIFGLGFAVLTGIIVGLIFFRIREQQRASMKEFSDAGGMIRLNLDQLTPDISPNRLLKD